MIFGIGKKKVDESTKTEIHWHTVQSSFVEAIAYDVKMGDLYVTLSHGSYMYYNVPQYVFDGFLAAQSKGSYFNRYIKDTYIFISR